MAGEVTGLGVVIRVQKPGGISLSIYIYTHSATREAHVYTHVHKFFFMFFSLLGYYKMLSIVPRLYSMSLLVIYFVYSSVMLIQNF